MHTRETVGLTLVVALVALVGCISGGGPAQTAESRPSPTEGLTGVQPEGETEAAEPRGSETPAGPGEESTPLPDYEIHTVLPKDAIPAIFDPEFLTPEQADEVYDTDEMILGVEINGDARAYSIPYLSVHEIVNDTVGGVPVAVTW